MADVPDHLLARAQARKDALAAKKAAEQAAASEPAPSAPVQDAGAAGGGFQPKDPSGKIPDHLLARAAARKAALAGGAGSDAGSSSGVATAPAAPAQGAVATASASSAAGGLVGPAGHTQRLLTVVKAGSIQDVKAEPSDKVNVWPHLISIEFLSMLALTAFLTVFSAVVNAPLLGMANYNRTPNPSKAPWYFLGLQELLTMFHPLIAGVTIPGIGLGLLALAPYIDKNPSNKPEDRKFAFSLMVLFMMFWAVLVIVGSFFRGEGFNFILPWQQGVHEIFDL
jgi:hypothetical protein